MTLLVLPILYTSSPSLRQGQLGQDCLQLAGRNDCDCARIVDHRPLPSFCEGRLKVNKPNCGCFLQADTASLMKMAAAWLREQSCVTQMRQASRSPPWSSEIHASPYREASSSTPLTQNNGQRPRLEPSGAAWPTIPF